MATQDTFCFFENGRQALAIPAEEWDRMLDWAGVHTVPDLYEDTPSGRRAAARLKSRLIVGGFERPTDLAIGPDYILALGRACEASGIDDIQAYAVSHGHRQGLSWFATTGLVFRRMLDGLRKAGATLPDLSRSWMTPEKIGELDAARARLSIGDDRWAEILRDFGGAVGRASDLDEDGFIRVGVYLEFAAAERPRETRRLQ